LLGVRRWARACALGLAVANAPGAAFATPEPPPREGAKEASAPNAAVLVAARELFREATDDVDAGRFDVALDKFKKVAQVKETPPVRFNVAKCEQALGRLGTALADYELAAKEGQDDPHFADIVKLAEAQATAIRPRVPRLTVEASAALPPNAKVTLDGDPLAPAALGVALPVDPGRHRVEVSDPAGTSLYAEDVDLTTALNAKVDLHLSQTTPPSRGTSTRMILGLAGVGAGVALGAASIVFTVLHNGAVSDLKALCNGAGGACLESQRPRAESLHGDAVVDKNLAIGLAIGAGAVGVFGAVLVVGARGAAASPDPRGAQAWVAPWFGPDGPRGLAAGARF
jgi:hypothetical protein